MTKSFAGAAVAAFLALGFASSNARAEPPCLDFTRQLGTGGAVFGTFADATAAAGAPPAAIRDAARVLGIVLDLERDLHDGDHFYLRWEQAFALDGQSTGDGRLLWAELKTKTKGTIVVRRFRPRDGDEQFFLASGQAAAPPRIRMPLDTIKITSGYGLRPDPLDQPVILAPPPPASPVAEAAATDQPPPLPPEDVKEIARAFAGVHTGGAPPSAPTAGPGGFDDASTAQINGVMARNRARRLAEERRKAEREAEAAKEAAAPTVEAAPPPAPPPQLFMHTGL